ncbi:hypothetical protein BU104_12805 [Staphylococcus xylosus]|uniref:Uncharacterized protein n=1 Tax=Staphylococcus xylosus TaxID=1288 RepID=A0AAQ0LWH9_STAXY|nr:type IV secretory system conjugative DNA transfer family protein [Staphylococcus xylosus]RIM91005.1 hypothetical protein BU104_12805 [Staphylococcus xylosus]
MFKNKYENSNNLRNGKELVNNKGSKFKEGSKRNLNLESGYILGKIPNRNKLLIKPNNSNIIENNFLVIGNSGSGKTQSYVIPNILNIKDQTIFVIDNKNEVENATANFKKQQGYKVHSIDFLNFKEIKYNPLYLAQSEYQLQSIAESLINESLNDNSHDFGVNDSSFFKEKSISVLTTIMIYVKYEYDEQEANLEKVFQIYNENFKNETDFTNWANSINIDHPVFEKINNLNELKGLARLTIAKLLENSLEFLELPFVKESTNESNFSFKDFIDDKSIIYLNISKNESTSFPLVNMFINQMLDISYHFASKNELRNKISFFFDNFISIGKIQRYPEILATCRGLGLSMHTIIQFAEQLQKSKLYSEDEIQKILGEQGVKLILGIDTKDVSAVNWLYKALNNHIDKNSLKLAMRVPLMEYDKGLLLINGYKPLEIQKVNYTNIYKL